MLPHALRLFALLVLLAASPTTIKAQDNVTRVSDKLMASWLKESPEFKAAKVGSREFQLDLLGHQVALSNDTRDALLFVAFNAAGTADLKKINAWNNRSRSTRAYRDEEGNPCLEMDIDFEGGINKFAFHGQIDWFRLQIRRFLEEVVD